MKALLSLALVAAIALAGCASTASDSESTSGSATTSKASGSAAGSSSGTKSGTSSTTATGTSGSPTTTPGANAAPVITAFTANITGLNVTFTLAATDANNDTLTYTLSFGDGSVNATGTLPTANVTHAFAAAGTYNATLTVSDGTLARNRTAAILAVAGAGAAKRTHVITGETLIPFPPGDVLVCIGDDLDGNAYPLAPAAPGWSYSLVPGDGSFGIYWQNGGAYVSTADATTGSVPSGIDGVEICNLSGAPMASYTLTLTEP